MNVFEIPSVHSRLLDEDWWTNKNTNNSNYVDEDKISSEDEAPIQKEFMNNTESTKVMLKRNIDESRIRFERSLFKCSGVTKGGLRGT